MTDVWPCGLDLPRMRALLDAGQDVNEKMKGGATALCKAAYKNRSDAVALLLEYEADTNSQCTNGDTALHYAMTYGDFDGVVELMLRAGASPGIRSHAGPSAYDLALNNKRRRSLALMDAETRRLWDEQSLGYTEVKGHPAMLALLGEAYGLEPHCFQEVAPQEGILLAYAALL